MNTGLTDHPTTELGTIQIAPEVLETIAGLASIEIDGVAGMSGGIVGGISELLGMKSLTRGVKVQIGTNETVIDVSIVIEYGYRIPDVSRQIQQSVQQAIYNMTGIHVSEVHIHIESVHFNEDQKSLDNEFIHTTRLR
ncbi:MAG: Asp23/Gls24 family envelope stress response protein [Paenibacillaceae bacterium]